MDERFFHDRAASEMADILDMSAGEPARIVQELIGVANRLEGDGVPSSICEEELLSILVSVLKKELDDERRLAFLVSVEESRSSILPQHNANSFRSDRLCQKEEILKAAIREFRKEASRSDSCSVEVLLDKAALGFATVSVVIPVYNAAPYLKDALDSLRRQSFSEFEAILVDDGSDDGSLDIMLAYAKHDERFVVLHQDNRGTACARNTGLEHARGKYVYFFDADDMLDDLALEKLYCCAEKDALDIVFFDAEAFYDSGSLKSRFPEFETAYQRQGKYVGAYRGADILAAFYRNSDDCVSSCLMFFRREFLIAGGLRYRNGIVQEDNGFYFAAGISAEKTAHLPERLFRRRVREGSVMTRPPSFLNAYGYYACFLDMANAYFSQEAKICISSRGPLKAFMFRTLSSAWRVMSQLDIAEWHAIYGLRDDCGAMNYAVNASAWLAYCERSALDDLNREREKSDSLRSRLAQLERAVALSEERCESLQTSLDETKERLKSLKDKTIALRQKNRDYRERLVANRARRKEAERELRRLERSRSYRVGRALLRPAVIAKRFLKSKAREAE